MINKGDSGRPEYLDEAVSRMKEMKLYKTVIDDFVSDNKLYMSEFGGILCDLNEEAESAVRETERYGLPYHVVRSQSSFGDMYAVLFVSEHQDEWWAERCDPETGSVIAYVYNSTYTDNSELGSVGLRTAGGGLMRVA